MRRLNHGAEVLQTQKIGGPASKKEASEGRGGSFLNKKSRRERVGMRFFRRFGAV